METLEEQKVSLLPTAIRAGSLAAIATGIVVVGYYLLLRGTLAPSSLIVGIACWTFGGILMAGDFSLLRGNIRRDLQHEDAPEENWGGSPGASAARAA
jgi:hypothetical protein